MSGDVQVSRQRTGEGDLGREERDEGSGGAVAGVGSLGEAGFEFADGGEVSLVARLFGSKRRVDFGKTNR